MKRLLLFTLLTPVAAQAASVSFEWSMDQPSDLVGYKIYHKGTTEPVFTITDPNARTFSGQFNLECGNECFYITAFDGSQESDKSNDACKDTKPSSPSAFKMM